MIATKNDLTEIPRKTPNPKWTVTTFVLLCFLFSSRFWYLIPQLPAVEKDQTPRILYTTGFMWCPAMAAILTRLWYQRNLKGFGLGLGKVRWLLLGMLIPVFVGLLMFGSAWISGVAPLNASGFAVVFSRSFIPRFIFGIVSGGICTFGEELGWRGFLVPELARCMNFTGVSLLSGAIWAVWHFPLIIFGTYHGAGPLWYSLAAFTPLVMGLGFVQAWLRLASGSIWGAVLLHGFWNFLIQGIFPLFTQTTPAGERMLGEFGWFAPVISVVLALGFWRFRNRLPKLTEA